jgi:hydroxyacylglutathione hydrolase
MFQRFSDEGLAQASYLIACERTREAIVVDPRRDIEAYALAAKQHGLTLAYAIETHVHADFVSGARELAALGARVIAGPGADLMVPFHEASHHEVLTVGDTRLTFLHTPGHTPEHISVLVDEPSSPTRVLTGDTLFVGAVGRPDLLGADQARRLGGQLYDSLFDTLLQISDDVEVHPGHGAGSLCGAGIGKEPHSTIGRERHFNAFLQHKSKASFVAAVLGDLPETPPYFPRMKVVNRTGPALRNLASGVPAPSTLTVRDAIALATSGAVVIDLRSDKAFGSGHPSGAMHIGFGPRIGYWAGWVVPANATLVLVTSDDRQAIEANRQLMLVGFDSVAGHFAYDDDAWTAAGGSRSTLEQITARDLRDRLVRGERLTVVDVRTAREWTVSHVDHAINLPVGDIGSRVGELRRLGTIAVICESGYRSALASSLLQRAGVDVVNVTDGTAAYRALAATTST